MKLDVNSYSHIGILVQQTNGVFTGLVVRRGRKINFEFINLAVKYLVWCPTLVSNIQGMIEHCLQIP